MSILNELTGPLQTPDQKQQEFVRLLQERTEEVFRDTMMFHFYPATGAAQGQYGYFKSTLNNKLRRLEFNLQIGNYDNQQHPEDIVDAIIELVAEAACAELNPFSNRRELKESTYAHLAHGMEIGLQIKGPAKKVYMLSPVAKSEMKELVKRENIVRLTR